jgi:heme iron utilization protein
VAEARRLYLARYADSKYWVDFEDFSFYRMAVVDVYYVGGFGVMGWVSDSDYDHAKPDPLADATGEIIQHMNADHKDALILLARVFARIESLEATLLHPAAPPRRPCSASLLQLPYRKSLRLTESQFSTAAPFLGH